MGSQELEAAKARLLQAQDGEEIYHATRRLCRAFAWHSEDVHYAQGMNGVAMRLLLALPEEEAFGVLCGLYEDVFYGPLDGTRERPDRGKEACKILLERLVREILPEFPLLQREPAAGDDAMTQGMGGLPITYVV